MRLLLLQVAASGTLLRIQWFGSAVVEVEDLSSYLFGRMACQLVVLVVVAVACQSSVPEVPVQNHYSFVDKGCLSYVVAGKDCWASL